MIASDIHGFSYYCRKMLDAYKREDADRLFSGIPVCDYSRHTEFSGSSRRGTAWTRKSDPLYASTLSCLLCLYGSRSGKYFCDRIL